MTSDAAKAGGEARPGQPAGARPETIPPNHVGEGGPDSPLEIGGTGWRHVLVRAGRKFTLDRCSMTAGSLAYHWFLAMFPALIALLGVASLTHITSNGVNKLVNG